MGTQSRVPMPEMDPQRDTCEDTRRLAYRVEAALLFALSALSLAFEIAMIRVFSYAMDPLVVFGAIAIAMLGLGIAGIAASVRPSLASGDVDERVGKLTVAFGVSVALSMIAFARLSPALDLSLGSFAVVLGVPVLLITAIPFYFAGLATTLLLGRHAARAHRAYAPVLLGSALGCFVLYPSMRSSGIERQIAILALLGTLSGVAYLAVKGSRAVAVRALAAVLLCGVCLATPERAFPFQPDPNDLYPHSERAMAASGVPAAEGAAPGKRARRELAVWDPISRVEVFQYPGPYGLLNGRAPIKVLMHDGGAGSLLFAVHDHPDLARVLFEGSPYGTAYALRPTPKRVLVIGLGGGPDVMAALHFGAGEIHAVEVNGATLDAVKTTFAGFLGDPYGRPNVHVHHADGRSFVEQRQERWDVIQLSGTDTYSAGGAGAFMFSESYLYTVEAIRRFIDVLEPDGVLAMLRFGPEPLRLLLTEVEAMRSLGIGDPERHFAIFGQGYAQSVIFSKKPIDDEQRKRCLAMVENARALPKSNAPVYDALGMWRGPLPPLVLTYLPDQAEKNPVTTVLAAARTGGELEAVKGFDYDYTPVTDNRPFFFQFIGPRQLGRLFSSDTNDFFTRGIRGHFLILLGLAIASALLIFGPLARGKSPSVKRSEAMAPLFYFGSIGLGFLFVELSVMQRTALLLGHPTYSISVTLASILTASAAGSFFAGRSTLEPTKLLDRAATALVIVIALQARFLDVALAALLPLPFLVRIAGIAVLLAPLGGCMGVFFPAGLRALAGRTQLLAWSQAVNAFASVLASLLAVPIALFFGFRSVMLVAAGLYIVAAFAARRFPTEES